MMSTIKAVLGYTLAALGLPIALVTFIGMNDLANLLVSTTGLVVSPWFSGGEVAATVDHDGYETRIHQTVFQALIGERDEGFVQVDWTPIDALPGTIDEEIDYNNDGSSDFRVELDTEARQAQITPYSEQVMYLEGVYQVKDEAVAIRVHLKNSK
jgi:hypothetical protein